MVCVIGMLVFAHGIDWATLHESGSCAGCNGNKYVTGLYMSVVTIASVGFGDISPNMGGAGMQVFGLFYMFIAVPSTAITMMSISKAIFGKSQAEISDASGSAS